MGEWLKTGDFFRSQKFFENLKDKNVLYQKTRRAKSDFFKYKNHNFAFRYISGIGRGGKVLQIWSEPLTQAQLRDLEFNGGIRLGERFGLDTHPNSASQDNQPNKEGQPLNQFYKGSKNGLHTQSTPWCDNNTWGICPNGIWDNARGSDLSQALPNNQSKNKENQKGEIENANPISNPRISLDGGGDLDDNPCRNDCVYHSLSDTQRTSQTPKQGGLNESFTSNAYCDHSYRDDGRMPAGVLYHHSSDARFYPAKISKSRGGLENASDSSDTECNVSHSDIFSTQDLEGELTPFGKASKQAQDKAMLKAKIIKEWAIAKHKVKESEFVKHINESKLYPFKITASRLYAWQRQYRAFGLDGLLDLRGKHKEHSGIIERNPLIKETIELFLEASRGQINLANIYESVHLALGAKGLINTKDFLARKVELFSYNTLKRYAEKFFERNKMMRLMIQGGESKLDSSMLPAVGRMDWNVSSINQIVEIDATSIDAILDVPSFKLRYGEVNYEYIQKRYVLIALIDVYSRVCIFQVADTENSLGVTRAIAKYIKNYGKPKLIRGDNGRAFKSSYVQEVCLRLGIDFIHTAPYSGWLKPYVESNFKKLQHKAVEWMAGFIGHSVAQRKAIEEFDSRKERRLKRGEKTHIKNLLTLQEFEVQIENYNQIALNKFNSALNDAPLNIYNERSSEALSVSDYELTTYLVPLHKKMVNKKGVSEGGIFYQNPAMFAHSFVYIGVNINDVSQAFVYDENKEFIDIALAEDTYSSTMEVSKASRKAFNKAKIRAKKQMAASRDRLETLMPQVYQEVVKQLPTAKSPQLQPGNAELEHSRVRTQALSASGAEGMELIYSDYQKKEASKKVKITWEDIAAKKK